MNVRHLSTAVAGLSLAVALSLPAQAANVSYAFSVSIGDNGSTVANQSFSGSFMHDDRSGTTDAGLTLYPLSAFEFTFDGVHYQLPPSDPLLTIEAAYEDGGPFLGLSGGRAGVFEFVTGTVNALDAFFAFSQDDTDFEGSVSYRLIRTNPAPEPAPLAMLALGLAGLTLRRLTARR